MNPEGEKSLKLLAAVDPSAAEKHAERNLEQNIPDKTRVQSGCKEVLVL